MCAQTGREAGPPPANASALFNRKSGIDALLLRTYSYASHTHIHIRTSYAHTHTQLALLLSLYRHTHLLIHTLPTHTHLLIRTFSCARTHTLGYSYASTVRMLLILIRTSYARTYTHLALLVSIYRPHATHESPGLAADAHTGGAARPEQNLAALQVDVC